jgi:putative PIN family toxin of toxin-antitoxin system
LIVFDSNVYISGLVFSKGNPRALLQMAMDGALQVAVSDFIVQEVKRVLREKFHLSSEDLQEAEELIAGCTQHVVPTEYLEVMVEDPNDNPILECAVAAGADVIVSGDTDLLRVGRFRGIRIVSPAEFLRSLK